MKRYPLLALALILSSCASNRGFGPVERELGRNQYTAAIEQLDSRRNSLYSGRDAVLYYLDKGMLSHYAQLHPESTQLLQEAERAIEEAFTRSITQGIGSLLVNDNTLDYPGEDYEDIYINVFNALNYYQRGEYEGAMVEIRRMTNKLQYLATKYDAYISDVQRMALDEGVSNLPPNPGAPTPFNNSALGRYLGMLFYRSAGLRDDARISRDWLLTAFADAPAVYRQPVPRSISDELAIPDGMARLNVLAFAGLSPVKKEVTTRILLPGGGWVRISLPEMVNRPSDVTRVELVLDDSGERYELELLEDMGEVARATFGQRQQLIYLRTIIRAMLKSASSTALRVAAHETEGNTSLALGILGVATQVYADVSERADIRGSRFFPARAYVTGINLSPGHYSFQIRYYNRNGRVIASSVHRNVAISEHALNLVQAVCLQ